MNILRFHSKLLILISCIVALIFFSPSRSFAGHDHDHIYVTMIQYVGFDQATEHFVIKVKRSVDDQAIYYYLHFLGDISSLRGHEGQRMQISLAGDGTTWARLSFGQHGTWNILSRERAE